MDRLRSSSGNGEDNVGIPDDLRCKRSDGKQWRCTAMSMPDKTVCEKHYIQAKKRAANSAMRASLRKKNKLIGDCDIYLESKSDEFDVPLVNKKSEDYPLLASTKKHKEKASKVQVQYSPETPVRSLSVRNSLNTNVDYQRDVEFEENWEPYRTPPLSAVDSSKSRSQRSYDASAMTESSDRSTDSSEETGGQTCHQCRRNDRNRVIWCQRCDKRGFCDSCAAAWYPDISLEEIEKICPACRGICNCRVCLRGDNMIKVRIREIPVLDKLQYLYCLLSSVLPVIQQIHSEQCSEVELEKSLRGSDIDLARIKLNADEQMCCNICRIPVIDYHWHCTNCSYDLCLRCCQDLRGSATLGLKSHVTEDHADGGSQENKTSLELGQKARLRLHLSDKYPGWKANSDGSVPCPPKEYGGCNLLSLNLSRIFKMNWVAKLVKNVEEMVSGCKVYDTNALQKSGLGDSVLSQFSYREDSEDNFLYCPSSKDIKVEGISYFRQHWVKGEPVIVKQIFDSSSFSCWDPVVIWRGIRETSDEKMKDENRIVKAIDCLNGSEVEIKLDQFMKGYKKGRIRENGLPEMLKLKDWPSPSASEEFLFYQKPDFISQLPLLEFIHSRLGLLNVAAKLPNYSLQNDVGPKIYLSYGTYQELGSGDSVTNLHFKMHDMVYLLVHTCEIKQKVQDDSDSDGTQTSLNEGRLPDFSLGKHNVLHGLKIATDNNVKLEEDSGTTTILEKFETNENQQVQNTIEEGDRLEDPHLQNNGGDTSMETRAGIHWDVFRRQDVPKLASFLQRHCREFGRADNLADEFSARALYDAVFFLDGHHKRKLKEEYGVEPWSFDQHLGQAVFVPAGCPFQTRNLMSNVQVGLDFLSPESVGEAVRLAEEIRCLPNDHEAKLQVLEVGKISLYAASSAIKEVQKLVLDPKLGAEIGFEDHNLTAAVSENLENLEKITKRRQITCA